MAKQPKNSATELSNDEDSFKRLRAMLDSDMKNLPEEFKNQSDDVVGYWSIDDAPCYCIPRGVKIFDGTIEAIKPSMLIIAELTKPTVVKLSRDEDDENEEAEKQIANAGDMVGVWYKPGMKTIRDHADAAVIIVFTGKEKDTGKPNPMKLFDVMSKGRTKRLPILEDTREKSLGVRTVFDIVQHSTPAGKPADDFIKSDGTARI